MTTTDDPFPEHQQELPPRPANLLTDLATKLDAAHANYDTTDLAYGNAAWHQQTTTETELVAARAALVTATRELAAAAHAAAFTVTPHHTGLAAALSMAAHAYAAEAEELVKSEQNN